MKLLEPRKLSVFACLFFVALFSASMAQGPESKLECHVRG